MTTNSDNATPKSKWPTGMTFLMYCAGLTLVLLAVSLVISGKPFAFSVDGDKVTLHGGLTPQGIPEEKAKEKSSELQQKFDAAKSASLAALESNSAGAALFNGTWEGAGATYILVQDGSNVFLSEITNGITTAFGTGVANGNRAELNIETELGYITFELIAESETSIRITGPGIPGGFYINKL
jgi:hypothetical protein